MTATATARDRAAAEFVDAFAAGWAIGATDPQRFFEHFDSRTTPDALFEQPIAADERGPEGLRRLFAPLFRAVPDLRGDVVRWGETADGVVIELRLHGTLGGRPLAWTVLDRIVLRDGRIAGRRSFFDPLPLLGALALRPRAAFPIIAARVRRKEPA